MQQAFIEGDRIPVTKIVTGPCVITQIKKEEKNGYWAIQLGFGDKKIKNITKPMQGHLRGVIGKGKAPRFLCEVKLENKPDFKVGDFIKASDVFSLGDKVTITGISKGKGFAGVVKRWGFAGGPKTHGQSDRQRAPGAIGQGTSPGRVHKGKKMPGRMGNQKITVSGLQVISFEPETGEISVSGPVPGQSGSLLIIKKTAAGKLEELIKETQKKVVEGEEAVESKDNVEGDTQVAKQTSAAEKPKEAAGPEGKKDE